MSEKEFEFNRVLFLYNYNSYLNHPLSFSWVRTLGKLNDYLGLKTSYTKSHIKKLKNILSSDFRIQVCLARKRLKEENRRGL